jgi:hypothetical protein
MECLVLGWPETVNGVLDIVLLTYIDLFVLFLQTYANIQELSITGAYFKQRNFSSSQLFNVPSCNIFS